MFLLNDQGSFQTREPLTTHYITNLASYNLIKIVQILFIFNSYISCIDIMH